ncbi:acyl dehydratase [Aquabacterium fontiphilum]|uniref:MaoC family dehydratase n=1 Tax=Aquabacterium fontiphilum TaxID=450365 RepID=UPI001377B3D5|nr:MaoC/PaaZ C-terminal domain-containing protein [Aquabacterium fontiphilum]NBD20058.1 acyl dehydratase [Aquabacterium fontiphilum]
MKTIVVNKLPGAISLSLGALRSSSKKNVAVDALPAVTYVRPKVKVDARHVAAYSRVCGFTPAHGVPLTYLFTQAFPLAMMLFGSKACPWPAMGIVHLSNHIRQHARISAGDELRIELTTGALFAHDKGQVFMLHFRAFRGEQLVWENDMTALRMGVRNPRGPKYESQLGDAGVLSHQADFFAAGGIGRRYGRVSGDINPIHLTAITAKLLGFRKAIAHGMWTKARALATLMPREAIERAEAVVDFKTPLFLPARASMWTTRADHGALFEVRNAKGDKPHLRGRVQY